MELEVTTQASIGGLWCTRGIEAQILEFRFWIVLFQVFYVIGKV